MVRDSKEQEGDHMTYQVIVKHPRTGQELIRYEGASYAQASSIWEQLAATPRQVHMTEDGRLLLATGRPVTSRAV